MSLKTYINPDAIAANSISEAKISNFKSGGKLDLHGHTLTVGGYFSDDDGSLTTGGSYMGVGVQIGTSDLFSNNINISPNVQILDNVNIGTFISGRPDVQNVIIGNKVLIHNNVVIGTDDRYYTSTKTQIGGNVYICDCIIGTYLNNYDELSSVKISKSVAIGDISNPGNGVTIGSNVNIGGSTNIGGSVNIADGLTISRNASDVVYFSWGSKTEYVNISKQTTLTGDTNLSITKTLWPNIYYVINNVANANISFKSGIDGVMNNYMFQIEVVSPLEGSNISISLPETIRWANGIAPSYEAGKIYQISVINNLGVFTEF